MKRLTIFTPTYNREHLLPKLYESLKRQTNKEFIWMIVDDGSNDDTKNLVNKFIKENKIEIDYYYKENGGKNTAIDYSNKICKTDYIACVDSDDYLTENSVENTLNLLPLCDKKDDCVGIVSRRFRSNGEPFQTNWLETDKFIYFYQLAQDYGYSADTYLIFKTKIIKNFEFPKIEGEKFLTEAIFYNQFMYDYMLLTSKDKLYIGEYMEDGYTADGMNLFFKNPKGYLYYLKSELFYGNKSYMTLKSKVGFAARIYAWKKLFRINEEIALEYKVKPFYKFLGKLLSPIMYRTYKNKYNEFLRKNDKNR